MLRNLARSLALTLIGIFLGAPASLSEPQSVKLDLFMLDYKFVPNHLTFQHGIRYRLHMENHGKETHEFTAPDFLQQSEIRDPSAVNADRTEILVQPGEQKDVYLVPRRGRYPLRCADHDWAGMTGEIVVE